MTSEDPNTTTRAIYVHKRISRESRDIRLLHLLPGKWEEDIRWSLEVAGIDKHPVYEALSYASDKACPQVLLASFCDKKYKHLLIMVEQQRDLLTLLQR